MTVPEDDLRELQAICPDAKVMTEGGYAYVHLSALNIVQSDNAVLVREALLCPQGRNGYATRLLLSEPVPGKGANWTQHRVVDRTWHTWSWQGVAPGRLVTVLAQHLVALR